MSSYYHYATSICQLELSFYRENHEAYPEHQDSRGRRTEPVIREWKDDWIEDVNQEILQALLHRVRIQQELGTGGRLKGTSPRIQPLGATLIAMITSHSVCSKESSPKAASRSMLLSVQH